MTRLAAGSRTRCGLKSLIGLVAICWKPKLGGRGTVSGNPVGEVKNVGMLTIASVWAAGHIVSFPPDNTNQRLS